VKKRGRRWVWVWIAAAATVVAVAILALLVREQPTYDFLRGATYDRTVIDKSTFRAETAIVIYETGKEPNDLYIRARDELVKKGWSDGGAGFVAPEADTSIEFYWTETLHDRFLHASRRPASPRYYVQIRRSPTTIDRLRAWLDRITNR
jgi:hypothetical protein